MQTDKDAEILAWVGRVGAAGAERVMGQFGTGRSWGVREGSETMPAAGSRRTPATA